MSARPVSEPSPSDPTEGLRALPLLARLNTEDVRALAARGRMRRFSSGTYVVREGEPGDSLYVILEGHARVLFSSDGGEEATLAHLGPGDCIGEMTVFDGLPRSASVVASDQMATVNVTRGDFQAWLAERPQAAMPLLEELSLRLRRANQGLADQLFLGLSQRLARRLVLLASTVGTTNPSGGIRIRITQADLASMLGVTRESVNKELQAFAIRGWLKTSRGSVTITDLDSLNLFR